MKKFLAVLLSLVLFCGCQKGPDASEVAEALCQLYVHANTAVSAVLPDWDVEAIKNTLKEDLQKQLKANLEAVGADKLDENSLKAVTDAMLEARKRIPVEVELLESGKDEALVKITVGALDLSAIDAEAAQTALKAIEGMDKESSDYVSRFVESYLEALQEGFETAEASTGSNSFEVRFTKQNGLWLPEDLNDFVACLGQMIRR